MSENKVSKAKNNKFYRNKKSYNSKLYIDVNFRGFLCSCNHREKDCVKEAYNLLNKYADEMYSTAKAEEDVKASSTADKEEEISIEDELSREVEALKSKTSEKKRFQLIDAGAKNFLFIRTTLEDSVEIAKRIVTDINESKQQQTRFLIRLVPVETTCKAYVQDIEKAFEPLCEKHFKGAPLTFSIVFNHRNNNSLSKDDTIKAVADMILKSNPEHKVNLKEGEVSVIIEVIKGFAFIGVVPDYLKFKKYNLLIDSHNKETSSAETNSEISNLDAV